MAKYDFLPKGINRIRRRIGRVITRKHLPDFVYRLDSRTPDLVRAVGFQPWNAGGTISILEHVNNSFAEGDKAGQQTKYESQWVSTCGYGMLKHLDPVFANQILQTFVYRIDTAKSLENGGHFYDVNDLFDKAGIDRPYATQREWIKDGGIPAIAIVAYMPGRDYFSQLKQFCAPDEDRLTMWQVF